MSVLQAPPAKMPPNEIPGSVLKTRSVVHADGLSSQLHSETSGEACCAMHQFLKENPPECAIEIGMAYGFSSLAILTALEENNRGRLISVDPYPPGFDHVRQSALLAIDNAGLSHRHAHVHAESELALPRLFNEGVRPDFVYIDRYHGFDHAFVDFFFADKLLPVGGTITFDDSRWRSVPRVIRDLLKHGHYQELNVGLQRSFASAHLINNACRRIQNRFGPSRYFRRTEDWKPPSSFYRNF